MAKINPEPSTRSIRLDRTWMKSVCRISRVGVVCVLVLLVSHIRLSCTFSVKKSYARSEGKELGRKSEKKLSQIGNTDSHNDTFVSLC